MHGLKVAWEGLDFVVFLLLERIGIILEILLLINYKLINNLMYFGISQPAAAVAAFV